MHISLLLELVSGTTASHYLTVEKWNHAEGSRMVIHSNRDNFKSVCFDLIKAQ